MNYFDALTAAMTELSKHPKSVFIGQGVGCAGTSLTDTLNDVPREKLIEFPVAEDLQMGFATGLAMAGWLPVCIFPRWNFLLCAANQLVNHLDRIPLFSAGKFRPKVIIRTVAPSIEPFDPGPQHGDDFTKAFLVMLKTVAIHTLHTTEQILPGYEMAMKRDEPTILVEYQSQYRRRTPSGVMS